VYILDTDPCPKFEYTANGKPRMLQSIRDYANCPEFSDITFIVEGKKFFAHKLILSLSSDRFKVMFSNGMIESKQSLIEIPNISYPVFSSIMHYFYTGDFHFGADLEGQEHSLEYLFEFLRVSDEYILEDVKSCCERYLIDFLTADNFFAISEQADLYNAEKLKDYCSWFYRRNTYAISGGGPMTMEGVIMSSQIEDQSS
jgi:BTB/POZ domain